MSTLLPLVLQQQQGGGQLASSANPSQYGTYQVVASWDGTGVFNGAHDDLVGEAGHGVKSVEIRRGRDDNLSSMQAGTCTIVLHDPDGLYNPKNASGALTGSLLPMRPVRVRASNDGVTFYGLFYGYIRSIEHDPKIGAQETRIEATDLFVFLDQAKPVTTLIGAPTLTTGSVIANLVSEAAVDTPFPGDFDTGDTITSTFVADGSKSCLALVEELLTCERGVVYAAANGQPVYESRAARTARTSEGTIDDTMVALRPGVDLDRVANRARVTRTGGETQEANDLTSQALYGVRDVGDIKSPIIASDADALTLAQYLVAQFKDPRSPMYGIDLINRDTATMSQIIQRDLQDRITVTDSRGGTSGDYHIEGIEHRITDGGKYHRCRWICSERGSGSQTGSTGIIGGKAPDPPAVTYVVAGNTGPSDPKTGDLVFYETSSGPVWQFRWNVSEWVFVGGSPLVARVDTDQSTTSGTYTATGFTSLSVTAPLAGDYLIRGNANTYNSGVATNLMSYQVGASAASDTNAGQVAIAAANYSAMIPFENRHTGVAASTAFSARYRTTAGTANFRYRWLTLTPIKVSSI